MNRLPPVGPSWSTWARQVSDYIQRAMPRLVWKRGGETAAENGIILWDEEQNRVVVSVNGVFKPLSYESEL
jgi:hypothetical protein